VLSAQPLTRSLFCCVRDAASATAGYAMAQEVPASGVGGFGREHSIAPQALWL
jgi:hypothetical protein